MMKTAVTATKEPHQNPERLSHNAYLELRLKKSDFKLIESLFYLNDNGELRKTSGHVFANHRTQLLFVIDKHAICRMHVRPASSQTQAASSSSIQLFGIRLGCSFHTTKGLLNWPETRNLLDQLPKLELPISSTKRELFHILYDCFESFLRRLELETLNHIPTNQRRLIEQKRSLHSGESVEQLANRLHIHPRSLQRLCQKVYQTNPKNLMQQLRREQSLQSCFQNNSPNVAAYCDQAHSIRDFKQHTHFSPKHFVQLWQDKTVRFIQSPHPQAELGLLIY